MAYAHGTRNRLTLRAGERVRRRGIVTVGRNRRPKAINTWDQDGPFEDQTVPWIYALEGDTLKLCFARPGQARRVIFAAFAAVSLVKRVTVVDADIDPWDPVAVDWARVNRMKLERDLLLVPHTGTDRSEPMEDGGVVTKAGFDATAKAGDRIEGIERALPPQAQRDAARAWLMDNVASEKLQWLK